MQLEYHNNQNGHRHGIVQSFDGIAWEKSAADQRSLAIHTSTRRSKQQNYLLSLGHFPDFKEIQFCNIFVLKTAWAILLTTFCIKTK